ncbi:hypothetical protein SAMN04488700_0860 [Carnobacterium iners]|uniref:Uncharacterized protein n=1 Tax=Carnobacterium iners TaxID=1073423 RepID=A0A1X7MTL6_9LACT|nr:hypothetical protein SAMN04488114_10646 [Carnobacterium iners]SMH28152.1 hypothetical protein SAMN04488700_0860 [Carnobacterium iners]
MYSLEETFQSYMFTNVVNGDMISLQPCAIFVKRFIKMLCPEGKYRPT